MKENRIKFKIKKKEREKKKKAEYKISGKCLSSVFVNLFILFNFYIFSFLVSGLLFFLISIYFFLVSGFGGGRCRFLFLL